MALHLLQPLLQTLHAHEHQAGLIGAVIAFVESLAVIGSFIPGSITLGAVGTLIGAGTLPALTTIVYISLGAFSGDFLSYCLGRHYQNRIHRMWPFTRYPNLLEKSRIYCQKHGGISIFIGRFTGPMRSFVPMITGMMRMPAWEFVAASLPSAFAWVIVFLIPGVLLGALSHEVHAKIATLFVIVGLLVIALAWFIGWCVVTFYDQISTALTDLCQVLWNFLYRHPTMRPFCQLIAHPERPDCAKQLMRLMIVFVNVIIFLGLAYAVLFTQLMIPIDRPIYYLLQSLRTQGGQHFAVIITMLGKITTIGIATFLIGLWLLHRRHIRYAIHLFATFFLAAGCAWLIKHMFYHPRPGNLMGIHPQSSFPSGHVAMSMAIIGLLGTWIREHSRHFAWISLSISAVLIGMIAISRLYLGMHWLSDVLGSLILGMAVLHAALLSFWRSPPKKHPSVIQLGAISVLAFLMAWCAYGFYAFDQTFNSTLPIQTSSTIALSPWWNGQSIPTIPLIRNNRFGQADHAFNIQWIGKKEMIAKVFKQHGWVQHTYHDPLPHALKRLSEKSPLPLFPKLYNNQKPDLVFTLNTKHPLIVRLWDAPIYVAGHSQTVWLGTLGSVQSRQHLFNLYPYRETQLPASQLHTLENALAGTPFAWKIKVVNKKLHVKDLEWDYRIIRIKPRVLN